jgi:putative tRNA adenosine deaminase-associated protein
MSGEEAESIAVVVYREDGAWQSGVLPERVGGDLDGLIQVLRQQPGENGAIGLVNVADEFFVALRVRGEEVRLMLSDVTAAVAWDLARQVVERLGIDAPPEEELDDVWPAGDVGIFADLGLD